MRMGFLPCWAAALLCLAAPAAYGQASVNDLFKAVNMNMAKGAFAEVIPDIQQLVEWLGDSKKPDTRMRMRGIFFNLGVAHFFLGEFDPAQKAFEDYKRRYPRASAESLATADLFIADCLRFRSRFKEAIKAYETALRTHKYNSILLADIHSSIARCHLAEGDWAAAMDPLMQVIMQPSDFIQYNWAATLLVTAYLKNLELEKIYPLVPLLLQRDSLASRSVAFNMAALEAGDELFATERYREALWVHRLVYPHDMVAVRSDEYLQTLRQRAEHLRETGGDARTLMRLQESIGELEEEIKAIAQIDNYDIELLFRVGRGYMESYRFWEAREVFLHLHRRGDKEMAEEALFLSFRCSTALLPWERAYEIGRQYMELYPSGDWFAMVTLAMGQMYAKEQNWPKVIEHLTKTLEMSPGHPAAAECMFLIGYASFMEELFAKAVGTFRQLNELFPQHDMLPDATYWTAMALMFDAKYDEAAPEFDKILQRFTESRYVEDSMFRRAVCDYGQGLYEDSDRRMAEFTTRFPESKLVAEATMMRGDLAAALGNIKEAVAFFRRAMTADEEHLNIEHYNHCAFKTAELLKDMGDYAQMREHFLAYLQRNREGANKPQAIYWIGRAMWNSGEQLEALQYYQEAVQEYGRDPKEVGIDLILDEWVSNSKQGGPEVERKAWNNLRLNLGKAAGKGQRALVLRLTRVLLYDPGIPPAERHRIVSGLLNEENIEHASPAVMQSMLDFAIERKQRDMARKIAARIIEDFTETDYALAARMTLARFAIEDAKALTSLTERDALFDEAIRHFDVVRSVHANTPEAGEALVALGWLHIEKRDYKAADEAFSAVLGPSAWRNLRPEALYGRGEALFAQRLFLEATAYYERIYVLYSHYRDWTAKAYVRRAECLRRLFQYEKMEEVLREMLAQSDLADTEAGREAKKMLQAARK
jgi:TolA-binding protein